VGGSIEGVGREAGFVFLIEEFIMPDVSITFLASKEKLPDVINVRRVETIMLRDGVTDESCLAVVSNKAGNKAPSDGDLEEYFIGLGYVKDTVTGFFVRDRQSAMNN